MKLATICVVLMVLLSACRDRGVASPESEPPLQTGATATAAEKASETQTAGEGFPLVEQSREEAKPSDPADVTEREATVNEERTERPTFDQVDEPQGARDLAAELNAAIGIPTDCTADFERATPTTIRVTLNALVRPSGAVIQATATGTGLTLLARQCIARRAEAVVLQPLEDGLSQRVSTVIEIEYSPPSSTVVGTKAGAPDPQLRNVREPLPKRPEVGPSGRPIQDPTSRPIQDPTSRPIQEPSSRKVRGPQPRPIDGWDVDESAKDWR